MSRYVKYAGVGSLAAVLCAPTVLSQRKPQLSIARAAGAPAPSNSASVLEGKIAPKAVAQPVPLAASYYQLPLRFESTRDDSGGAQFVSRGAGYSLFLAPSGATLVTERAPSDRPGGVTPVSLRRYAPGTAQESIVRFQLRGANRGAAMSGLEEQPGRSNYFIGSDPDNWRTNVRQYGKVRISDVYPGVDVVYYGNQRELEYDFLVEPGADPNQIRMQVSGGASLRIGATGDAEIETDAGTIRLKKPVVFQEDGSKKIVPAAFRLAGPDEIAFQLGFYDRSRALVIDPVLSYSVIVGGNDLMEVSGVTVDAKGDAYVTGYTCATDFPVSGPNFATEHNPGSILCHDVIVVKFDPQASSLVFSDVIGGTAADSGARIAVDSQQNVYVAGLTSSTDFPTTAGAVLPSSQFHQNNNCNLLSYFLPSPCFDAFALKLSADGSTLMYSTLLGGSVETFATDIKVNSNGQAYGLRP